jgi:hypothetical protein
VQVRDDAVDGLSTWVRWIIVVAVGLSPILAFWSAGVLGRFLRRKRAQRGTSVVGDWSGSTRKEEAIGRGIDRAP